MTHPTIKNEIIKMKDRDQKILEEISKRSNIFDDYHKELRYIHQANALRLQEIIEKIGFPTISKVGKEGYEAAFIIIQHAIDFPDFMKISAEMLKKEASTDNASIIHYAYLIDRIHVYQDLNQIYGTQFDFDASGEMCPINVEDLEKVNHNRLAIGLNSIYDQIEIMRNRAKKLHQLPPKNPIEKKKKYDMWRKEVGWI